MLNPSMADEKIDDPTIKKCVAYSKKFNHDELYVVNLFPQIQKKPNFKKLKNCQTNKLVIEKTLKKIDTIYLAWGFNYKISNEITEIIKNKKVFVLELSKNNTPKHPLYLKNNIEPVRIFL